MRMPTSRSVPIRIAPSVVTSSFTFCRIGLGLRAGATLAAIWKACSSLSRSQVAFMDWYYLSFLSFLSSSISMSAAKCRWLAGARLTQRYARWVLGDIAITKGAVEKAVAVGVGVTVHAGCDG